MFKSLLIAPLQHAMLLLWGLGIFNIVRFPLTEGCFSWSWIVSAICAALFTILLAAYLRRPLLVSIAIALGVCSVVAISITIASGNLSVIGITAVTYALCVWIVAITMMAHPATKKILDLFSLSGGYDSKGGVQAVESVVHWCSFALAIAAIIVDVLFNGIHGQIPTAPLLIVGVVMLFLAMSGKRYHLQLHSYICIALGAWFVLTLFVLSTQGTSVSAPVLSLTETWQGLVLAGFGLVLLFICGSLLKPLLVEENPAECLRKHYYLQPLLVSAAFSVSIAAAQGIIVTLTAGVSGGNQWVALASCGIAGFVLLATSHVLRRPLLTFAGAALVSLTLLWIYSALIYGSFPLLFHFGGAVLADQWLLVSVLALILAFLARYFANSRWQEIYEQPIFTLAILLYGLGCFGVFVVYTDEYARIPLLPLNLIVLICTLFPLPPRLNRNSGNIRGVGIACLLSVLVVGVADSLAFGGQFFVVFLCSWAYAMWGFSNLLLPGWNSRYPQWMVSEALWPWLGLVSLGMGLSLAPQPVLLLWPFTLATAGFCFLMMRNSSSAVFRWLFAMTLTWSGILFSGMRYWQSVTVVFPAGFSLLAVENLLWINILLLTVPWFRQGGANLLKRWQWKQTELATVVQACSLVICCLWLVVSVTRELQIFFWGSGNTTSGGSYLLPEGILVLSLLHGLWCSRFSKLIHPLLAALFCFLLGGWGINEPFSFPVFMALWTAVLLVIDWLVTRYDTIDFDQPLQISIWLWLRGSLLLTLACICIPDIPNLERLITLVLLSVTVTILGCRTRSKFLLAGASLIFVVILHGVWFIPIGFDKAFLLLPWFSCELVIFAWVLKWISSKIAGLGEDESSKSSLPWQLLGELFNQGTAFIIVLAVIEWIIHFGTVVFNLMANGNIQWLFSYGDSLAALLAIGLVILRVLSLARKKGTAVWTYGVALLVFLTVLYIRILLLGLAPFCLWDSGVLMAAAFGLLVLQHVVPSQPLLNIILVLPILSFVTVLFQHNTTLSSITLLLAALFYILVQRKSEKDIFLNIGLVAFNGAVYLWVPGLVAHFGLLQIYLIPAAVTVLFLTHLHRHELTVAVINGTRLAALSILYCAVTMDVFLVDSLLVFALALLFGLAGIIAGIALRIRAFFFTGTAFLVINVFGQLLQLYPEQRLGRALLLMGLGAIITGSMIWFNMKREMILRKIRIYRADLESWD